MKNITINFILKRTSSNYEDIHKTGIYKIYHLHNKEVIYLGSAASDRKWREGFKQRWIVHLYDLQKGIHHSDYLQRVVNKYGIEDLRFEILEICDGSKCLEREQYYLDTLVPFGDKGYNTCKIAGNTLGYKIPEHKKGKRKKIDQYSLEGNFIQSWDSLNQASRELDINVSSIKDCCKKRFKQIKGFIFRYSGETDLPNIEEIRTKLLIDCIYEDKVLFSGDISYIEDKVPDNRHIIYKLLKNKRISKNGWKYLKQTKNGKTDI